MTKSVQFFATKSDLEDLFGPIEKHTSLKFVQAGRFDSPSPLMFSSINDLPSLGIALASSSTNCRAYLVSESGVDAHARKLPSAPFFAFDQLENPRTVVCNPGGVWNDRVLITGSIGTASKEITSANLMRVFSTNIKKKFSNVRGVFVGSEAEKLWKNGYRLTDAEQSPSEFDLAP